MVRRDVVSWNSIVGVSGFPVSLELLLCVLLSVVARSVAGCVAAAILIVGCCCFSAAAAPHLRCLWKCSNSAAPGALH
jgi:hypothetical protein